MYFLRLGKVWRDGAVLSRRFSTKSGRIVPIARTDKELLEIAPVFNDPKTRNRHEKAEFAAVRAVQWEDYQEKSRLASWEASFTKAMKKAQRESTLINDLEVERWFARFELKAPYSVWHRMFLYYSAHDKLDKIYPLLQTMRTAEHKPTERTYDIIVKAYARAGAVDTLWKISTEMEQEGMVPLNTTCMSIMQTYAKQESAALAIRYFESLEGKVVRSLLLYHWVLELMQKWKAPFLTAVGVVQKMTKEFPVPVVADAKVYEQLLGFLVTTPINNTQELWTAYEELAGALTGYVTLNEAIMLAALQRSAQLPGDVAHNLLSSFAHLQKVLPTGPSCYDRLVSLLCEHGHWQLSLEVLRKMRAANIKLGVLAELSLVRGFVASLDLVSAEDALDFMTQLQSIKHTLLAPSIRLLMSCVSLPTLETFFVQLRQQFQFKPTLEDYNQLLDAYARAGDFTTLSRMMAEATRLFKLDVHSYNALLLCLCNTKQYAAGLKVLEVLTHSRVTPTTFSLCKIIDCAGVLFQLKFAQAVLDDCESNYGFKPDVAMWTSLLVAWCRAGKFETVMEQFSRFCDPSLGRDGEVPASLAVALLEALQLPNNKVTLEESVLSELAELHKTICAKGFGDRVLSPKELFDLERLLVQISPRQPLEEVREAAAERRRRRQLRRELKEEAEANKPPEPKTGWDAFIASQPAVKAVAGKKKTLEEKKKARLEARKRRSQERRARLLEESERLAPPPPPPEQLDRTKLSALADLLDASKPY